MSTKRMLINLGLLVLLVLAVIIGFSVYVFADVSDPWWNTSWMYRTPLTINGSLVNGSVSDFPLLVTNVSQSCGGFWSNVNSSGTDLVVTNQSGAIKYDRELVSIDTANQSMELWVNISDGLSEGTDKTIYLYYGNSGAAEVNSTATWDSDYTTVYHMSDNPDNQHIADSTAGNHDGTKGGAGAPTEVSGKINRSQDFNSAGSEYILDMEAVDYDYSTNNFCMEFWIKWDNPGGYTSPFAIQAGVTQGTCQAGLYISNTDGSLYIFNGAAGADTGIDLVDDTYAHVALRRTGTGANELIAYKDGAQAGTCTFAKDMDADRLEIGRITSGPYPLYYKGELDELRFSSDDRSRGWVITSYNNQNSPDTFYTVGNEEIRLTCPITLNITAQGGDAVSLNWTQVAGANFTVRMQTEEYPANYSDGQLVYHGTDNYTVDDGLSLDITTYYYRVWADYCGGYANCYGENTIGGEYMLFLTYGLICLGLSGLAFWRKWTWVFMLAAIAWFGFGGYGLSGHTTGEIQWVFGWVGMAAGLVLIMAPAWNRYKDKREENAERLAAQKDITYDDELDEIYKGARRRRHGET